MLIVPPKGLLMNAPMMSEAPYWRSGVNVRFWDEHVETIGLFGPLRNEAAAQVDLPGSDVYRSIFTTPSPTTGQILAGSASELRLLEFDGASSTPGVFPRFKAYDIWPSALSAASDTLTDPGAGRVEIPPTWWFSDQDDVVVGTLANGASTPVFAWDRDNSHEFVALSGSPTGAVGGAIINRILFLLGCTSFTEPDPQRFLTVRWSDRFNFEDWTPSDLNWAGELQLEGGSRIIGGGNSSFGIIAWTDNRMARFVETGDIDTAFARIYIDGGRGLMANRAWCEADGVVWWIDASKSLNYFDGGRPQQVPNPLKSLTLDRVSDVAAARVYLVANPDYNEVLIWYPSGVNGYNPDACVVYNYALGAWSYWQLPRPAWCQRFGIMSSLGVDLDGKVFRHDLSAPMGSPWSLIDPIDAVRWQLPAAGTLPLETDVTSFDFLLTTGLITPKSAAMSRVNATRLVLDHVTMPASGVSNSLSTSLIAYGKSTYSATKKVDTRTFVPAQDAVDFRVGGKLVQLRIEGISQKTVWRFGGMDFTAQEGGQR